ncbi:bifunctional histidinol-phosphatase/imidazoleglycerol-phosphate dehydratase HisB [Psychroflexus sp. ALD_RP9]|uniref:bifunctional histidinol-phosphatase/imidazoleglycerol-phosphate dehydratase HisB n=1 Tax=Psychroflexus sp. ALD_RP9 TaxID=2777186 RepID=UPI001A8C5740|nr:bifunctional histidinol-phosphatase/imidazoleglycerol-phosphate dehydratase HisB [Psychroflexus sp. ALD_RP9]QSS97081.1 bifunctional histidinol-phosphatase/imidazoleglycerol-phosphate dehydratase HisB [Psychroflexus sp. ALD_RP9]
MKPVLFIDRDGTIIAEPKDEQVDDFSKLKFLPHVITALQKITKVTDYELVMITNQDGLGTDQYPEKDFWPIQNFIVDTLASEGISFSEIFIDKSFAKDNSPNRKPNTGLLGKYFKDNYDLKKSFVIGDRLTDVKLAQNLGAQAIFINNQRNLGNEEVSDEVEQLQQNIVLETTNWDDIKIFLCWPSRKASISRNTKETQISVEVNLDGTGKSHISTGLAFFDHMLDQISKHGLIDLNINTKGDLDVDEHHTIEDTALALGEAFAQAIGDKLGVERYGFCLPMDDCLAQVAIDFGGRNWLVWEADFKREMIGKMPTEMFMHFFKSFSDAAKANLNIKAEGQNEHHKIEAIFKAFAKAIKMAVKRDPDKMILPSTKGTL